MAPTGNARFLSSLCCHAHRKRCSQFLWGNATYGRADLLFFLFCIAEGNRDTSEQQRVDEDAENGDQDAQGGGQDLEGVIQGVEGDGLGGNGGDQNGGGSDQDAGGGGQEVIVIPPRHGSRTMKKPITKKQLCIATKDRNEAYEKMASRLQDKLYEMGVRMPEVNGLLLINSGVSIQYKGHQTGAGADNLKALKPLLEQLLHPDPQERKMGAEKLDEKGDMSGLTQETLTPQQHISAAIQHLEKAVHGVSGPSEGLMAVSTAVAKAKEAESVVGAMSSHPVQESHTQPSKGRRKQNVRGTGCRAMQASSRQRGLQPLEQPLEQPPEQVPSSNGHPARQTHSFLNIEAARDLQTERHQPHLQAHPQPRHLALPPAANQVLQNLGSTLDVPRGFLDAAYAQWEGRRAEAAASGRGGHGGGNGRAGSRKAKATGSRRARGETFSSGSESEEGVIDEDIDNESVQAPRRILPPRKSKKL